MTRVPRPLSAVVLLSLFSVAVADLVGEGPALGPAHLRITQAEVESGQMSLHDMREAGLLIFATAFNQYDGYGDGPMNPADPIGLGGRPTLGNNGTFLRVNGLDAQRCNDCHAFVSSTTTPPILGVGGAGNLNNAVMFMPTDIDVDDSEFNGSAAFNGRLIVPPSLFGAGGLQLLASEMTTELQALKAQAIANPGTSVRLLTKGVDFGYISANAAGALDTSLIEGIDADLVVKPFGRKGEFATVRGFDIDAMRFHFGIQPSELVGAGIDDDGDGITDEILPGELSVLEIFIATQDTPRELPLTAEIQRGYFRFMSTGCGKCHRPQMQTSSSILNFSFPQIDDDPNANVFFSADLSEEPAAFPTNAQGGLIVRPFADLKRHDLGSGLAENFQGGSNQGNREFMTAELWGVADTAPYLHDGRALTLNAAILAHGGEAQSQRDLYESLAENQKNDLLNFLHSLRSPVNPNADVLFDDD